MISNVKWRGPPLHMGCPLTPFHSLACSPLSLGDLSWVSKFSQSPPQPFPLFHLSLPKFPIPLISGVPPP